jgi:hypothetical protein
MDKNRSKLSEFHSEACIITPVIVLGTCKHRSSCGTPGWAYIVVLYQALSHGCHVSARVGNFRQRNYSLEDGIDETIGLFQRNSGCSVEQKTLKIPFRTFSQRRRMLAILYHGTKQELTLRIPF